MCQNKVVDSRGSGWGSFVVRIIMAIYQIDSNNRNATPTLLPATMGKVVGIKTSCERVMSDVWEMVTYATYESSEGEFRVYFLRGEGQTSAHAEVDATVEVMTRFVESKRQKKVEGFERALETALDRVKDDYRRVVKGKMVEVFKGRKVPVGTKGVVMWVGMDNYRNMRVGIKVEGSDKLTYVAAEHCKVVEDKMELLGLLLEAEKVYQGYLDAAKTATAEEIMMECSFTAEQSY